MEAQSQRELSRRVYLATACVHRYRLIDRPYKRIWQSFKQTHTLLSGLVFRGQVGLTRAQTVQLLLTSIALELVVLCMFYSEPSAGPMVINPVKVAITGCLTALIVLPGMLIAAWLFAPLLLIRILLRLVILAVRFIFCWPCFLSHICSRREQGNEVGHGHERRRGGRGMPTQLPCGRPWRCSTTRPMIPQTDAEVSEAAALELRHGDCACESVERSVWAPQMTGATRTPRGLRPSKGGTRVTPEKSEGDDEGKGEVVPRTQESNIISGRFDTTANSLDEPDAGPSAVLPLELRQYSYASLDEHMLVLSFRRSWSRRDWRNVLVIGVGWLASWSLFISLLGIFSIYGCEFCMWPT